MVCLFPRNLLNGRLRVFPLVQGLEMNRMEERKCVLLLSTFEGKLLQLTGNRRQGGFCSKAGPGLMLVLGNPRRCHGNACKERLCRN